MSEVMGAEALNLGNRPDGSPFRFMIASQAKIGAYNT